MLLVGVQESEAHGLSHTVIILLTISAQIQNSHSSICCTNSQEALTRTYAQTGHRRSQGLVGILLWRYFQNTVRLETMLHLLITRSIHAVEADAAVIVPQTTQGARIVQTRDREVSSGCGGLCHAMS